MLMLEILLVWILHIEEESKSIFNNLALMDCINKDVILGYLTVFPAFCTWTPEWTLWSQLCFRNLWIKTTIVAFIKWSWLTGDFCSQVDIHMTKSIGKTSGFFSSSGIYLVVFSTDVTVLTTYITFKQVCRTYVR